MPSAVRIVVGGISIAIDIFFDGEDIVAIVIVVQVVFDRHHRSVSSSVGSPLPFEIFIDGEDIVAIVIGVQVVCECRLRPYHRPVGSPSPSTSSSMVRTLSPSSSLSR